MPRPRALATVLLAAALAGCAVPRTAATATPVIEVKPGFADRIALMDRYRLHDEERKLMMARPRVWVEEAPEEEAAAEEEEATEAATSEAAAERDRATPATTTTASTTTDTR